MTSAAPVHDSARVDGVDVARGLALLGIFCVNIQLFAEPFGMMMAPPTKETLADTIAHYAAHTLCTGKFYGLFSLLFGIGFALMRGRAEERGASFTGVYLRRILFLAGLGVVHALALWYGDILFIYAGCAVVLFIFKWISPRAKVITAVVLFSVYALFAPPMAALQQPQSLRQTEVSTAPAGGTPETSGEGTAAPDAAASPVEPGEVRDAFWSTPFGQLIDGFKHGRITDPSSREWQALERRVYMEGPYGQLFLFRAFTWVSMLVWCLFGFNLTVVAMFFIGSALAQTGRLGKDAAALHRRLVAVGFLVGLPLCGFAAYAMGERFASAGWRVAGTFAMLVGSPLLSLGYLGAVLLWVNSGAAGAAGRMLASTGRMALTNYLMQTVVATTLFYYYGLGWFGTVGRAQQLLIVAGIFAVQVMLSVVWMKAFRFGPMEWLWRSFTYLKAQPMRRVGAGA